jgi:hypothetical protein
MDLSTEKGTFEIRWYNPRAGGALLQGTVHSVEGGGIRAIGQPPADRESDWVALIKKQ